MRSPKRLSACVLFQRDQFFLSGSGIFSRVVVFLAGPALFCLVFFFIRVGFFVSRVCFFFFSAGSVFFSAVFFFVGSGFFFFFSAGSRFVFAGLVFFSRVWFFFSGVQVFFQPGQVFFSAVFFLWRLAHATTPDMPERRVLSGAGLTKKQKQNSRQIRRSKVALILPVVTQDLEGSGVQAVGCRIWCVAEIFAMVERLPVETKSQERAFWKISAARHGQ